jgi:adenylate cyclase
MSDADHDTRTLHDVAAATGLGEAYLRRHFLAAGLPMPERDEPALGDDDLEAFRQIKALLDTGLSEDAVLEMVRAGGRGAAQVAAIAVREGDIRPALGALTEAPLRWHLREQARRAAVAEAERGGSLDGARDVAVAFVDLAAASSPSVTRRWEALASELVTPPVTLVKLIGNAAMLVSADAEALVEALWALVGAAAADPALPAARAGAAAGAALPQGGDWYGGPVDLALRITTIAEPDTVVAEPLLARRTADAAAWVPAGVKRLEGVAQPIALHRLRAERVGAGG